jgi:hypothetical protein
VAARSVTTRPSRRPICRRARAATCSSWVITAPPGRNRRPGRPRPAHGAECGRRRGRPALPACSGRARPPTAPAAGLAGRTASARDRCLYSPPWPGMAGPTWARRGSLRPATAGTGHPAQGARGRGPPGAHVQSSPEPSSWRAACRCQGCPGSPDVGADPSLTCGNTGRTAPAHGQRTGREHSRDNTSPRTRGDHDAPDHQLRTGYRPDR